MEWALLVHKRPFPNLIHPSVRPDETSIAINLQIEKWVWRESQNSLGKDNLALKNPGS